MNKYILFFYFLLIFLLALYSFVLVDPNITFVQSPLWIQFREYVIQIGYYQRELSWVLYLGITILLFAAHTYFVKRFKDISAIRIAIIVAIILLFSYPFLSHDLFNYMFDAKIFTYYSKNPYFFKALDFPTDEWTRFMHWTHRTYPYGPVYLMLSFIPSYVGLGKFTLTFILFKGISVVFYLISVVLLTRLHKKWGVIFATHPLILIEGLVSSHNDFVALGLGIIGVYILLKKTKSVWSRLFFLFSAGIKYTTFPDMMLIHSGSKSKKINKKFNLVEHYWNSMLFILQWGILGYLTSKMGIQPWYFLSVFVFLPFFPRFISRLSIFFFGLLISYYPYIRLGGWGVASHVTLKHTIIYVFIIINILYVILDIFLKERLNPYKKI